MTNKNYETIKQFLDGYANVCIVETSEALGIEIVCDEQVVFRNAFAFKREDAPDMTREDALNYASVDALSALSGLLISDLYLRAVRHSLVAQMKEDEIKRS